MSTGTDISKLNVTPTATRARSTDAASALGIAKAAGAKPATTTSKAGAAFERTPAGDATPSWMDRMSAAVRTAASGAANGAATGAAATDSASSTAKRSMAALMSSVVGGGLAATSATAATPPIASTTSTATGPASTTQAEAQVYDASAVQASGSAAYAGSSSSLQGSQGEAATAAAHVQEGIDYYASTFGRDGIDNAGNGVDVVINDRSVDAQGNEMFIGNGGYYAITDAAGATSEAIRFGVGTSYQGPSGLVSQASMLHADDLTIHELTHGVIRKETGALGGQADESGATNEAIADVMAASATRDWRIGEGMYTADSDYRMMRDIANPSDPTAIHGLYTTMQEVDQARAQTGEAEEHWASGVISTAAARMQQGIGGETGWQVVENVFYGAMTQGNLGDMSYDTVARALRSSADSQYGAGSYESQWVSYELGRAGL